MDNENINSLRPLIEAPVQVNYAETYDGYKNKFVAIKWRDNMHDVDNTRAEFFYNICYIDSLGKYHELGSSKVMLEILQNYFQYIGNIDGPNGSNGISFVGD